MFATNVANVFCTPTPFVVVVAEYRGHVVEDVIFRTVPDLHRAITQKITQLPNTFKNTVRSMYFRIIPLKYNVLKYQYVREESYTSEDLNI